MMLEIVGIKLVPRLYPSFLPRAIKVKKTESRATVRNYSLIDQRNSARNYDTNGSGVQAFPFLESYAPAPSSRHVPCR